jgi:hypothetical protein
MKLCSAFIFAVACAGLLTGCKGPGVWERSLQRGPEALPSAAIASADSPTIRRVPWDRVQSTLSDLEKDVATSDVHPDDWDADRKRTAKGKLLRGLQVSQDANDVLVLGHSSFRSTEKADDEQELLSVARRLGADMVVWSSRVLGKADTIVDRPVSTNTWGTGWYRDASGERRPDHYNEHSTSWVPVRMTVDEVGAVAYFLRVGP